MFRKLNAWPMNILTWFGGNALGFGALAAALILFPALIVTGNFYITTFLVAIPISLAQWIVLRRILKTSPWWILTIPIGFPLGFYISQILPTWVWPSQDDESLATLSFFFAVIGLTVGLLQWIILRRNVARASVWILASGTATAAAFGLILVTDFVHLSTELSFITFALTYAIVTGLFLAGLMAADGLHRFNLGTPEYQSG